MTDQRDSETPKSHGTGGPSSEATRGAAEVSDSSSSEDGRPSDVAADAGRESDPADSHTPVAGKTRHHNKGSRRRAEAKARKAERKKGDGSGRMSDPGKAAAASQAEPGKAPDAGKPDAGAAVRSAEPKAAATAAGVDGEGGGAGPGSSAVDKSADEAKSSDADKSAEIEAADEAPTKAADASSSSGAEAPADVGKLRARLFGRSDVGQVREHNEDNLLIADLSKRERGAAELPHVFELGPGGGLLAVCDGMGGAAAGEIASQLAVDIVYDKMLNASGPRDRDRLAMAMVEALEYAGVRILNESNKNRACRGMGTTATVAAWVDDHLLLGQVGDSRGYLLRGERLVQLTRDQSLVNQLIEAGQLTEEEAENFEHSNIILQALGTADAVQVDLTFADLRHGDMLLLCSDGLSGIVRDDELREILMHNAEPAEACRMLIDEANDSGGHDNITAIVAVFEGSSLKVASAEDIANLRYRKYPLPPWMDHRNVDTGGLMRLAGGSPYDDTPYIEVHGEIELGPEANWDDLLEDTPRIPTSGGPSWSTVAIVAILIGIAIVGYLLLR